jgi:beta-1,4-mannosyl-glycoprotein beta-1,4-N-acetylglucosaminyltransferase
MPKVYDVQTFFNELDTLELKLNILNDSVDYFVINEATTTFSGKSKPLYFYENRDRYKRFSHKIIHNVFDENKPEWDQWNRDRIHKNAAFQPLTNLDNCDIVIYSDADEVWNPRTIEFSNMDEDALYICMQKTFYYYLNTEWYNINTPDIDVWRGSKYSSYKLLKQHSFDTFRDWNSYFHLNNNFKKQYINNCGWHWSFLGGSENIKYKIDSYGHQEFNCPPYLDRVQDNIDNLKDPFFRPNFAIRKIEMEKDAYPEYLLNNLEKYDKHIYKG